GATCCDASRWHLSLTYRAMNRYFPAMMPRPEPKLLVSFSLRLCIFAAAVSVAIFWIVRTTPQEYYLPLPWACCCSCWHSTSAFGCGNALDTNRNHSRGQEIQTDTTRSVRIDFGPPTARLRAHQRDRGSPWRRPPPSK